MFNPHDNLELVVATISQHFQLTEQSQVDRLTEEVKDLLIWFNGEGYTYPNFYDAVVDIQSTLEDVEEVVNYIKFGNHEGRTA